MPASGKTKSELEAELKKLQFRVDRLKKTIAESRKKTGKQNARSDRKKLTADIEFFGDFDLIKAKTLNISDSGICFMTSKSLPFEMRFEHNGQTVSRRANLIWLKHENKSGFNFGLKFVNINKYPQF